MYAKSLEEGQRTGIIFSLSFVSTICLIEKLINFTILKFKEQQNFFPDGIWSSIIRIHRQSLSYFFHYVTVTVPNLFFTNGRQGTRKQEYPTVFKRLRIFSQWSFFGNRVCLLQSYCQQQSEPDCNKLHTQALNVQKPSRYVG